MMKVARELGPLLRSFRSLLSAVKDGVEWQFTAVCGSAQCLGATSSLMTGALVDPTCCRRLDVSGRLQLSRSCLFVLVLLPVLACGQDCWANALLLSQSDDSSSVPAPWPAPPPSPIPSGFPDSTNTGPVPGTIFQDFTGDYEVRQDGTVINGLRVTGSITVHANNVTIQNCEVNAAGQVWGIAQVSGSGLTVKNCRIYGIPSKTDRKATHVLTGVDNATEVSFTEIYGVENALTGGSNYLHDNYIHDFARWIAGDDHTDGLQTYGWSGAGGLRVIHNTIIAVTTGGDYTATRYGAGSSAIALSEEMHDLTIDNNFFAGGTYTLYGPSQAGSAPANVRVTNNRFSKQYFPRCGEFGPATGFNRKAPGFLWSGNVWHETGFPVRP